MLVTIERTQKDLDDHKRCLEYFQEHHPEMIKHLEASDRYVWHDVGILETATLNPDTLFDTLNFRNVVTYGVCDNYAQVVEQNADILQSDDKYLVHIVCIDRDDQPETDGWRWHKWGEYIGIHEPTTEYLYDDPDIDRVYVYRIYKIVDNT